ncbi:hypothetical protein PXH78_33110 [Mycolicibacterium smegmatis]|uniref:hypothetical protein n=1 Tax=Mycolicibacterium smegmatis TaxID=1772 RepID=UPI0005D95CA7|nr:hypothetical protein [Mycolicibacterium smegmatis]MDF1899075.1 hypothetical protein [Mycolicibacterium smegmatis]MDF1904899.1 hypothetical protein [Mycolicibacterium smegmatis]MDF1922132.1 hypothetical protein [Mycolicibacterium smegmatis]MDF1928702.1 hypothetical protein [Mycolicibacterium smegmatis]UAK53350.1 hypothetical protein K8P01_22420 [Mycolicibacterium smegmatis]
MALTYFAVTGTLHALISDSSTDDDGNPDVQYISCFVDFAPSVRQVHSSTDNIVYRLQTIRGRTSVDDGELKTIDGNTLTLVANSAALDLEALYYTVTFSNVVYDGKRDQVIEGFRFLAPTDDTAIDLSTVERLPLK